MTPAEYIYAVENAARNAANICGYPNIWRKHLQDIDTPGTAGDFDVLPEVYLGAALSEPWFDHTIITYTPIMHDLIKDNAKAMCMTEDEIVEGLHAIKAKWPRIVAWTHYKTLHVAMVARMPRVIKIVTEWMEQRGQWFMPVTAPYNWLSREYKEDDINYNRSVRLDIPPLTREGLYNLPAYFNYVDWSTMNTNHAVEDWVESTNLPQETIHLLGRALASNPQQWVTICCASMNGYHSLDRIVGRIVGCIAHAITDTDTIVHVYPSSITGSTPIYYNLKKAVWHTYRSRCALCKTDDSRKSWWNWCLPINFGIPIETFPITPYEQVMAHAVIVRRRKFRGLLYCAAVLVGKARILHFKPGIGAYYKEAEADWNALNKLEKDGRN